MAANVPGLVTYIAHTLADHPEQVEISEYSRGRQRIVHLKVAPEDMQGRIGSIVSLLSSGANALGALCAGAILDALGARTTQRVAAGDREGALHLSHP